MAIEKLDQSTWHIEAGLNAPDSRGLSSTGVSMSHAADTRENIRPSSITSRVPELWAHSQAGDRSSRSAFSSEASQSPWRPTAGPWGSPPPPRPAARPVSTDTAHLQQQARLNFASSAVSLQTGLTHGLAALSNFRHGNYLLGLHYGASAPGYFLVGVSQAFNGLSNLAKANGQNGIGKQLKEWADYFRAGGGPLAGFGRVLRDMNTALTTLADPNKSAYERQRDLAYALGTILNTAGASGNAVGALTGNPNVLLHNVEMALANSGSTLRGWQNLQRNAQGLSNALSPFNLRNVAAYGVGMIYGLSEASAGMGHALAAALKESGYTLAGEALADLSTRAHNVSLLASNTQILINSLIPAT